MSSLPPETENRLRDAIRRQDPLRDVPMPLLTPEQIRAGTSIAHRVPDRRARWLPTLVTRRGVLTGAAALAVAGGVIGARILFTPEQAIAAPAPLAINPRGVPAREHLLELAAALANQSITVPVPDAVATTHTRLQRWSLETTNYSGTIIAHDEQAWWQPDLSGRTVRITLPAQPAGQQTAQYLDLDQLDSGLPQEQQDYPPGTFPTIVDGPPAADPAQLAAQLSAHQPDSAALGILRGIADLYEVHHLYPTQRIATLTLLASNPDIVWRGETVDRARRTCVAISLDNGDAYSGRVRDILLIAPNGAIYGHEQIALTAPSLSPDIPKNTVTAYTLYLITEQIST